MATKKTPTNDTTPTPFKKKVGDKVTWISQARGTRVEKTGEVLALLPAGSSAYAALKAARPNVTPREALVSADISSARDRYLIEVMTGKNNNIPKYVTPLTGAVDC